MNPIDHSNTLSVSAFTSTHHSQELQQGQAQQSVRMAHFATHLERIKEDDIPELLSLLRQGMGKKQHLYDQGHEVSICIGELDDGLWDEMISFFERVNERELEETTMEVDFI